MKKKQSTLPDLDTIRAARETIKQELERRKTDGPVTIVTGVPRGEGFGNWEADALKERDHYRPELPRAVAPEPRPPKPRAPSEPKEWHYVWVQLRAPNERTGDLGTIAEGQYGVADNALYLNDIEGNAIASQDLRPTTMLSR